MTTLNDVKKEVLVCERLNTRLSSQTGKLSIIASEYLGFDVIADVCSGGEIEFRPIVDVTNNSADAFTCWTLEQLPQIKKDYESEKKRRYSTV